MAKIVDPDDLNQNTEITIVPGASGTIQLEVAGNLSNDGVTLQAVYSFLKEEWKTDSNLIKYPFPLISITEEQFELINSWSWYDSTTETLIRDGGWRRYAADNSTSIEEWMNVTTLGSFDAGTDKAYYLQVPAVSGGTPTDMVFADAVNEAVQIYAGAGYGNFDYRDFFKIFLREEQKTYDSYDLLTEQNLTALTYKKYAMPLANAVDIKVTNTDAQVASGAAYANIDVTYYTSAQQRSIGGTPYDFHIIIDADSKTTEQTYEKIQYLLRQPTDIDAGSETVSGDTADELLVFVGDTLKTLFNTDWDGRGYGGGVHVDNFAAADTNSIEHMDDTGTYRLYPFVASGSLLFNDNLVNDTDAFYWMFFTSVPSGNYGDSDAIIVQDNDTNNITGAASASSIEFTFDYDNNNQGGRTEATNAPITVVAIGLNTAQFVSTTSTITRSKANNISLVAALERNYSNPL